ncbi:PH domain-containing protein [Vallicoccus soli]|uniref:PH domain-containing protein n=1 Tax=Vallicoccus soli TaxID=2339232 RepID=A0A3A3Z446_9ACTN|nr:PH domain-containing protein [Vallicoccus soli]RJK98174.1 PH domain-containing protein [Vallicoccus soli]
MVLLDAESSRARRFLLPHERLVAEVRWHPVRLTVPLLVLLGVAALMGWLASAVDAGSPVLDVAGVVLLVTALWFAWQVLEWWQERLIITDRRIMLGTGVLTRKLAVMPLRKVTDMTYERPLIGRLFAEYGWGTFVMESAGQDQALHRITPLPYPDVLYARLSSEIFGDAGMYGSPPPAEDAGDGTPVDEDDDAPPGASELATEPGELTPADDRTMIVRRREDD